MTDWAEVDRVRSLVDVQHWNDVVPVDRDDMVAILALADALTAKVERLTRWKAEATEVLAGWERVWDALGRPGPLGASKALSSMVEVNRMREGR